ncbi:MAG TPA: sugar kinase [Rhodanobacteraceae bacterium]|nr:sugar kinase [Rhodanobacteraceae bacterium]
MKPILVAGEINVDLVFGGCPGMPVPDTEILAETFHQVPGSSSMICAMGLARLGEGVTFVGRAGADSRGAFCIDALRAAGIDTHAVRQDPTLTTGVTVAVSTASDRGLLTFAGSITALTADVVDDALLASARHLHVSALYLQRRLRPGLGGLFARARALGLTTSLDPGFDPEQRWGDEREWADLLQHVDVFLPSRGEALAIAQAGDVDHALAHFARGSTLVVIKCADDGALALRMGEEVVHAATRAPEPLVDSTGAGDSFDAGFLHAWLAHLPLRECLRWGNACGGLSMRGMGGTARQADVAEVEAWLGQGT